MKYTNLTEHRDVANFAQIAAEAFRGHPSMMTFTQEGEKPGDMMALRYGLDGRSVVVVKLAEDFDPIHFADCVLKD